MGLLWFCLGYALAGLLTLSVVVWFGLDNDGKDDCVRGFAAMMWPLAWLLFVGGGIVWLGARWCTFLESMRDRRQQSIAPEDYALLSNDDKRLLEIR